MKKNLKSKIEAMNKEKLVELIEQMCRSSEAEKLLKLIVSPSRADIDRALRKFYTRCEIYVGNSCNEKAYQAMYEAAEPLYVAYKYADEKMSAYITYGMHAAMEENDLLDSGNGDYYELLGELLDDLEHILKRSPELFAEEEFKKYCRIVELDD